MAIYYNLFIWRYTLTEFDNIQVRIGDSIAVFNALFWAFHIVFISKFLRIFNFPITIACLQCLIASIFALMPAFVFESVKFSNMILDGKEMLYAGILSSGVAFLLQIYGQQNLSPAPVAIIFSLEGVFASIFGWIILSQFLNEVKIIGIILILFAVIFSQLAPLYDKKVWTGSNQGFMKHLGGLELKKISDTQYEFTVEIKEIHLNTGKIVHGGSSLPLPILVWERLHIELLETKRSVTINLDMKFISVGKLGDKLVGKVKILKKTKT